MSVLHDPLARCMHAQVMQCPTCDGQGEESTPCNTCGGDGRVRNSKKISLRVPAGAASHAAAQVTEQQPLSMRKVSETEPCQGIVRTISRKLSVCGAHGMQ